MNGSLSQKFAQPPCYARGSVLDQDQAPSAYSSFPTISALKQFKMITGLELFFAVAPLIIAGTEPYRKLYDKARTLSLRKHKNDQHMDFLRNLQHEVALLQLALISLVTSLPGLSVIDKQRLLDHKELHYGQEDSIWNDESVQEALRTHLHEAFSAVSDCLSTILKNLDNLISDRSTGLHKVDLVSLDLLVLVTANLNSAKFNRIRYMRNCTRSAKMARRTVSRRDSSSQRTKKAERMLCCGSPRIMQSFRSLCRKRQKHRQAPRS